MLTKYSYKHFHKLLNWKKHFLTLVIYEIIEIK